MFSLEVGSSLFMKHKKTQIVDLLFESIKKAKTFHLNYIGFDNSIYRRAEGFSNRNVD